MPKIELIEKFKPLFTTKNRIIIVTGGRGSAKSFSITSFITLLTFESNHRILFTRYTMSSAHLSVIPELNEKIQLMDLDGHFSINKAEIVNNVSKSEILFRGLKNASGNQTANLKSISGVTTWVLDEAEELTSEADFDKINLSIRKDGIQNRVILILNPASKEHFIYKRFFEEAGIQEGFNGEKNGVTYIHTTYQDNIGNLNQAFLDEVEKIRINRPDKYKHQILGAWLDKAEGVVFTNWRIGDFAPSDATYFGQDYGFTVDPTTLIEVAVHKSKKQIYVRQRVYKRGLDTTGIYNENARYAGKGLIIADSAEPRLIAELKARGCNVKGIDKPKIIERIRLLQDYEIIVCPDSIDIIKELNNYVWSDRKSDTPIDDYNHALDAIGYVVWHAIGKPNIGKYNFNQVGR